MAVDPLTGGAGGPGPSTFVRYRKGQCSGTQNALKVITEVHEQWGRCFGRYHAPLIESYRMDGAEYAIMTIGSMTGAAKDAVDEARERGDKVGLVKVKTYRPFPVQALAGALADVKAVGVVDRSVSFGWNCGPLFQDTIAALYYTPRRIPAMSFIGGLAGADLTVGHFERVIRRTAELARDGQPADRKSTRLNSSHANISYAVFCLKKTTRKDKKRGRGETTPDICRAVLRLLRH